MHDGDQEWPTIDDALKDLEVEAGPQTLTRVINILKRNNPSADEASLKKLARQVIDEVSGRKDITSDNDDGA